jgi:mycofactocin biosynthesis protein MftB
VSTEQTALFRPDSPYRLSDQVVLRPEPFGALAYDLVTRRLVALRDPDLAAVLDNLHRFPSARAVAAALVPDREAGILRALDALAREGLIRAAD